VQPPDAWTRHPSTICSALPSISTKAIRAILPERFAPGVVGAALHQHVAGAQHGLVLVEDRDQLARSMIA